jgi:nucleotide-binding universal stress UspA family protein
MKKARGFRVVVATDGSAAARAAVAMTVAFPWPIRTQVEGVVARHYPAAVAAEVSAPVWAGLQKGSVQVADAARRALRRRWPAAEVVVLDRPPVEAILARARGAEAVVVGTRGHGALGRLVLGSVSRGVVRRAACSTLVVRGRPSRVRNLLVGLDGSTNARRAVSFVARLRPLRGRVTLVRVLEPVRLPSLTLMPSSVRSVLERQLAEARRQQIRGARRELGAAGAMLRRAGWRVRSVIRWGRPVDELLSAGRAAHAQVFVVGARGTGGLARLLLGSVAEGILDGSRASVLVVR